MWQRDRQAFRDLFQLEREVTLDPAVADALLEASLITCGDSTARGVVRIWPFNGRFYASDLFTSDLLDRVYPVYVDQGAFFAAHLAVRDHDQVLDVGTGSGILAIESACLGAEAVGIDINPRATAFARFNAALNNVRRVTFLTCDLDDYDVERSADVVLCNPPFTAVPEDAAWYLHGSAGYDGLGVFRRFLPRLSLAARHRLQVLVNSLGTATEIQAVDLIREHFPDAGLTVRHLYEPRRKELAAYTERFHASPAYKRWQDWLGEQGFSYVYRMLITIDLERPGDFSETVNPGFHFEIVERFGARPEESQAHGKPGGWDEMLLRYGSRTR
jgi:predicted RNA methylase